MRKSTNIQICKNEVILHILDPKKENHGTFISSQAISMIGKDSLYDFFRGHIQNGLNDSSSKAAKFKYVAPALASGICSEIISQNLELVSGSQQIANCLNIVMEKNHNISSGDLVVCLFETGNYPGRFLALLKIDPSNAFLQKTLINEKGQNYIDIQMQADTLPSTRERLQKCAFIQSLNPRNPDYDMLLLDRQSSAEKGEKIARFFISDFLDADYALDSTQRTQKFYDALVSARTQIQSELSDKDIEDFDDRIRLAVTAEAINLDIWVDQLPISPEQKQAVNDVLLNYMPDREFEINRQEGERLSAKRRFRAEYDFRLSLTSDGYKRVIKEDKWHEDDPTRPRYHRLVIETEKWDEISKPR